MHSPRPYGLQVVNGQLSENDKAFIDHQLKKLSNQKDISNLDSIRQVKDLPDGGYVILQDMGGILKAIAYKPLSLDGGFELDGLAKLYIPMLYSGVISNSRVRQEDGVGLKVTEQCRKRLINYSTDEDLPAKQFSLQRFVIEPNDKLVPEFVPRNDFSDLITTQYVRQRPTWYSGAMAEVMQIVGGFGQQNLKTLPDNFLERAQFKIPDKYIDRIVGDIDGVRLPAYTGVPPIDGKFQYDYKFHSTNGVVFDATNKPWLVRISSGGVYAMPLPIIPATATSAFREYIAEVGDDELLKILDRFGAMPSGEGFPRGQDFQAWQRAGAIIKVCDTADFYSHIQYSATCGWSFNLNGTEGFNTAYTYNNEEIAVGVAYKLRCEFSPAENQGWLKPVKITGEKANVISKYLSKLYEILPKGEQKTLAILYKLRRVSQDDIFFQAETSLYNPLGVTSVDVDYWDNLELEPITILNGNISQVAKGFLYHNAKFLYQPQIKFAALGGGACISFNFDRHELKLPINKRPNCDTIMFGFYDKNSLKVIKYFVDWRTFKKETISNFEKYMIVGSWEETEFNGDTGLQGHFYTTDLDIREETPLSTKYTKIVGKDLGYDSVPRFGFDDFYDMQGTLFRVRHYSHLTKSTSTYQTSIAKSICLPCLDRNSYALAYRNTNEGGSYTESFDINGIQDPNTYRFWTYDRIWHYRGGLPIMKGSPFPKDSFPVWAEYHEYHPTEYSDFADQGDWLGSGFPFDVSQLTVFGGGALSGGGSVPKQIIYSKTSNIPAKKNGALYASNQDQAVKLNSDYPREAWFISSPDDVGNVFYLDACKVVFGDSEYGNISETNENNLRYKWGYSRLVEHKSAYHFIGVINE